MSPDATVCGQAELLLVGRRSCCWSASPPHCPCSSRCTPAAAASRMLRTAPSESRHARHYGRLRLSCRIQRPRHCRLRHCPRLDLLGQQLVGSSCQRARTDTPCARFRGVWGAEAFRAAVEQLVEHMASPTGTGLPDDVRPGPLQAEALLRLHGAPEAREMLQAALDHLDGLLTTVASPPPSPPETDTGTHFTPLATPLLPSHASSQS